MNTDEVSILEEIRNICKEYKITDITNDYIDNEDIKRQMKTHMMNQLWRESTLSVLSQPVSYTNEKYKPYHYMTRMRGRSVLLWKAGALRFRNVWRKYYEKKKMSFDCPKPLCGHPDTFEHSLVCMFNDIKMRGPVNDFTIADYLTRLNRDRMKDRMPIL